MKNIRTTHSLKSFNSSRLFKDKNSKAFRKRLIVITKVVKCFLQFKLIMIKIQNLTIGLKSHGMKLCLYQLKLGIISYSKELLCLYVWLLVSFTLILLLLDMM